MIYSIQELSITPSWFLLLCLLVFIIGGLALYTLLTYDKLLRFQGKSQEVNAEIMSELIARHFGSRPAPSNTLLKHYRLPTIWKMGKRIVVLFDDNNILMNIATFNYKTIRSPLHGFFDHLKIYKIKREFFDIVSKKSV
jgi:hypothetical protein